ncbi:hypothetical protein CDAR_465651 [Caerostris darwini]|uniref:Uncharacterized protein n=1 Tax=Caerostris darwini TaxID=1538125 RepID=A0AAV4TZ61_9ARAC|nr:hypothetical protein CDAR_465651 [Caerostris darwini]
MRSDASRLLQDGPRCLRTRGSRQICIDRPREDESKQRADSPRGDSNSRPLLLLGAPGGGLITKANLRSEREKPPARKETATIRFSDESV